MWTEPGRAEKACPELVEWAGPERQRWVNNSGYTWGAGVNNGNMIDDLGEIKGVALWMTGWPSFFEKLSFQ